MSASVEEFRKTSGERCEVRMSDGSVIKTTVSVAADFSAYAGREFSGGELESFIDASRLSRAKDRAMRMIGARPMSQRELFDRLVEKGETEAVAAQCLEWLTGLRLMDDGEYAAMVVRHYAAKGYGPAKIKNELYRRKVPRALWDEALEELPEQDGVIDRLLSSKLRGRQPGREELKKAADSLLRRGFSWDEVRAAVSRYNSQIEEEY